MTVIMPARRQTNGQWPGSVVDKDCASNGMVGRMAIGGWQIVRGSYAADQALLFDSSAGNRLLD